MEIPETFKQWASSLSGCDGGNPDAKTWICGIEWGGGSKGDGTYYTQLPAEISKGRISLSSVRYDWAYHITYSYGISVAKLYASITGHKVEEYVSLAKERWGGSELFKLNLYPIAFDSTKSLLWEKYQLKKITGFEDKYLYQTWCIFHRFPEYAKLCAEKSPELIIGTGVSYLRDFIMCFGGHKSIGERIQFGEIPPKSASNRQNPRRYYWVSLNNNKTLLVVIPFLSGSYGLNSDYLLQEMGKRITKLRT